MQGVLVLRGGSFDGLLQVLAASKGGAGRPKNVPRFASTLILTEAWVHVLLVCLWSAVHKFKQRGIPFLNVVRSYVQLRVESINAQILSCCRLEGELQITTPFHEDEPLNIR